MLLLDFEQLIKNLINEETSKVPPNDKFLSIYFPVETYNPRDISTIVNSLSKEQLSQDENFKGDTDLRRKIEESVLSDLRSISFGYYGIAIFIRLTPKKRLKSLYTTVFAESPLKEGHLDSFYDLDQLVMISNRTQNTLIIELTEKTSSIYAYNSSQLKKLNEIDNTKAKTEAPEYIQKYRANPEVGVHHGTGSINEQRQKEKHSHKFWNMAKTEVEKVAVNKQFHNVILMYTKKFDDIKQKITKDMNEIFGFKPVFINRTIQKKNEISEIVKEHIKKNKEKNLESKYHRAKSNFKNFTKDWNEIAKASSYGKIMELYIDPKAKKEGYLVNRDLIYTKPVKDSHKVKNIAPWIIRRTLSTGGDVFQIPESASSKIAAQLRF